MLRINAQALINFWDSRVGAYLRGALIRGERLIEALRYFNIRDLSVCPILEEERKETGAMENF